MRQPKTHYQLINQALCLFEVNDTERRLISFLNANGAGMVWTHKDAGTTLIEGLALELDLSVLGTRRAVKSLRDRGWAEVSWNSHGNPLIALIPKTLVHEAVRLQEVREYRRWIGGRYWAALMACRTPDERTIEGTREMLVDLYQQAADLPLTKIKLDTKTLTMEATRVWVPARVLKGGTKARMAYVARELIRARQTP